MDGRKRFNPAVIAIAIVIVWALSAGLKDSNIGCVLVVVAVVATVAGLKEIVS